MGEPEGDSIRAVRPTAAATAEGGPWTVRRLLTWIESHLAERGIDSPRVSAEILLGHVLGCERLRLYMEPERLASEAERLALRSLVLRAARHEPVQYLVGRWPFHSREFDVSPATLIPRPATETLVDEALRWVRATMPGQPLRMADIGTGTGVIAVSVIGALARRSRDAARPGCRPLGSASAERTSAGAGQGVPEIQVGEEPPEPPPARRPASPLRCLATDLIPEAVELARRNVVRHGLADAIDVRQGSLYAPFRAAAAESFDLIASNPPYVSDREWSDELAPNVRDYEPASALRGGPDGLDLIRPLVADAPRWLRPGGLLLIEIGHRQRDAALGLVADGQRWRETSVLKDHEDYWRVLRAVRI